MNWKTLPNTGRHPNLDTSGEFFFFFDRFWWWSLLLTAAAYSVTTRHFCSRNDRVHTFALSNKISETFFDDKFNKKLFYLLYVVFTGYFNYSLQGIVVWVCFFSLIPPTKQYCCDVIMYANLVNFGFIWRSPYPRIRWWRSECSRTFA